MFKVARRNPSFFAFNGFDFGCVYSSRLLDRNCMSMTRSIWLLTRRHPFEDTLDLLMYPKMQT